MGEPGQKPSNKQPNFLNLLVLVHLKNYFIEALNKFLMCFETNGFKTPPPPPPPRYLPILLYSSRNIFIVKTP